MFKTIRSKSLKSALLFAIPLAFFVANLYLQTYNFGKFLDVITDEGVYLYAAKLVTQGLVPYKDFFLAHPPFLIAILAPLLKLVAFDINWFHFVYSILVLTTLFPLFFLVRYLTKSTIAASLSLVLFSTYQGLVSLYAREFSLRAFSLPFLAFALYFFYGKKNQLVAGALLALFAMAIIPNALLAVAFVACLLLEKSTSEQSIKRVFLHYRPFLLSFGALTLAYYAVTLLIPSAYDNIITFQVSRPSLSFTERINILHEQALLDWPLYLFGMIGAIVMLKKHVALGLYVFASILLTVFTGKSFYEHYLIILAVPLILAAGFFFQILTKRLFTPLAVALVLLIIYQNAYHALYNELIVRTSPHDFEAIARLKAVPEPVFTDEPILALYAGKTITPAYFAADMRAFATQEKSLDDPQYATTLQNSQAVILGPYGNPLITPKVEAYIEGKFQLIYESPWYKIYIRR